jgi:lipoprotein-anchoring transpeptidase ErfK/SrfK
VSEANEQNIPNAQKRKLVIVAGSAAVVVVLAIGTTLALTGGDDKTTPKDGIAASADSIVPAPPVPPGLETVVYDKFQSGFPADPEQSKTTGITEGVHPLKTVALYDAVGGKARSMAAPTIATNVDLVMPVVDKRNGWVAVLVPSANRSIAWLPDKDLEHRPLVDHVVVYRKQHKLVWLKNDKPQREWEVTLGAPNTPTPLGRSYVLARSALTAPVYAGEDVLALSSVPDDPMSVKPTLRGAHTGIHTWHSDENLGKDVSDGCIRLTKSGHQLLLRELEPGTPVTVLP